MQYGCFKPYYNWNTFNTSVEIEVNGQIVKSFKPYYNWNTFNTVGGISQELIQGLGFKPYYNWNTFNTLLETLKSILGVKF